MRLTRYSDYSLRVLLYLAAYEGEQLANIKQIAEAYGISKNHLMKITYNLGKMGYIETVRGRSGGLKLAKSPCEINIGEIVRKTEEDFYLVECFEEKGNGCVITPVCTLKHILNNALQQFLKELDKYTLEDLLGNRSMLHTYFSARE